MNRCRRCTAQIAITCSYKYQLKKNPAAIIDQLTLSLSSLSVLYFHLSSRCLPNILMLFASFYAYQFIGEIRKYLHSKRIHQNN